MAKKGIENEDFPAGAREKVDMNPLAAGSEPVVH